MKGISYLKTLVDAFKSTYIDGIPHSTADYPDWFKKRLAVCDACPYNNMNMSKEEKKNAGHNADGSVPRCSVCGCFIKQKCFSQMEECSLGERGQEPRWKRMAILTQGKDTLDLINLTEDDTHYISLRLSDDSTHFVADFGEVMVNKQYVFKFKAIAKKDVLFEFPFGSCSCIRISGFNTNGPLKECVIEGDLNLENYALGAFTRVMTIRPRYDLTSKDPMNVEVEFVGTVIENPEHPSIPTDAKAEKPNGAQ